MGKDVLVVDDMADEDDTWRYRRSHAVPEVRQAAYGRRDTIRRGLGIYLIFASLCGVGVLPGVIIVLSLGSGVDSLAPALGIAVGGPALFILGPLLLKLMTWPAVPGTMLFSEAGWHMRVHEHRPGDSYVNLDVILPWSHWDSAELEFRSRLGGDKSLYGTLSVRLRPDVVWRGQTTVRGSLYELRWNDGRRWAPVTFETLREAIDAYTDGRVVLGQLEVRP